MGEEGFQGGGGGGGNWNFAEASPLLNFIAESFVTANAGFLFFFFAKILTKIHPIK